MCVLNYLRADSSGSDSVTLQKTWSKVYDPPCFFKQTFLVCLVDIYISALQTSDSLVSALNCVQPKQDGRNPSTAGGFHVRYLTFEAGLTLSLWNSNYRYRKGLPTTAFHSILRLTFNGN